MIMRSLGPLPPYIPREHGPDAQDVGDYQTFGIAGFFGVPVSFMELGKGSETHLCPVILTPKNLVPEITASAPAVSALTDLTEK